MGSSWSMVVGGGTFSLGNRWLHNNVDVLNATELHTEKWLKWYVLRYVCLPIIKRQK